MRAWAAHAPLYLALALGVFAAYAAVELVLPLARLDTPPGQFKLYVIIFTGIFAEAFVIAAVAIGVAQHAAGKSVRVQFLLGAAVERWLPVIAVSSLAVSLQLITSATDGLGPSPVPRPVLYVAAPLTWIVWGILSLASPLVALAPESGGLAIATGFVRAFSLALSRHNLLRLCIVSLVLFVPPLAETLLQNALEARHVPRAFFWANAPIDALTIGPLSAIATAFVLDFARRVEPLD